MVESIAGGAKADDPHGSESHSSEVVHEGEDAAFGDTTHDSLNTDEASINGPLDAAAVSADDLNTADLENADADTVPTAQGDGTLAMERAGRDGYVQRGPTTFDITLEP